MTNPTPESDADLLRKIKAGDTQATRLLVDQYLDRIVNYGTRMLGDRSEAEDVAQEAFLRLWRNLDKWRAEAPVIHWLQRVTYNLCIDRLRKKKPVNIDDIAEPEDPFENPAKSLHEVQVSTAVNAAIQKLPERQRAAIVFAHQEGLSNIETAEIMEISVEAVESLLSRGRRGLRDLLQDLRPELQGDV
ncbi:MAG: RNA polymerase sigma factor [Rhodospirillaceae bacterium]|jgi:RNA polymerase sigma-70 factor, ECF subfamily|nr:RNA polymerase sigma factor [Rhodospirillaceae bacterium]MBT4588891.1 RNA polymerase sigma factor [Rhodospirillaceae bacterium]MBT4939233.1 RNA polymerase sigma factor [Rhodospirillaceae bacterium]MBT7268097.1 RNA polymerase sigma factor [Rhodospirillaceae bacterium]